MLRILPIALVLVALPATAKSRRELVTEAQKALREALDVNDETDSDCQMVIERKLGRLLKELKPAMRSDRALERALAHAKALRAKAEDDCPGDITTSVEAPLDRAIRKLDRALNGDDDDEADDVAARQPPPQPPPQMPPPQAPPGPTGVVPGLDVGPIAVQPGEFQGAPVAMLSIGGVRLRGMAGRTVAFSVTVKSFSGNWLPPVPLDPLMCNQDVCAWNRPLTFYYPEDALRAADVDGGRFVAMLTATDAQSGQPIGSQQLDFRYRVRPPLLVQNPPPPPPLLDCGTGPDPACTRRRNGALPMERTAFDGFVMSLRSNANEILRRDTAAQMLAGRNVTTRQLGVLLDLFPNEIMRFEIAERALPHVVDPENAIGVSAKFQNSIYQSKFSQLAAQQQ